MLLVAAVVAVARVGLFPGTGEAFEGALFHHPYRLSMAVTGGVLALGLGTAAGWFGVRRKSLLLGVAVLAAGGVATGVALSFSPPVLYPGDRYPVSFGWLVGGAPVAGAAWLAATLLLRRGSLRSW